MDFVMGLLPMFKNNDEAMGSKFLKKKYINPIMKILWTKMLFKAWLTFSKAHTI